jgi:hypothetical protein
MQIGKLMGASLVIGTSTNAQRRARLKEFSCDLALDSKNIEHSSDASRCAAIRVSVHRRLFTINSRGVVAGWWPARMTKNTLVQSPYSTRHLPLRRLPGR